MEKIPDQSEEIAPQQLPKKPTSKLKRVLQTTAGAATIVAAGFVAHETYDSHKQELDHKMVSERFGFDIQAVAEQHRFSCRHIIPNSNGRYVIHIGQDHYKKELENNLTVRENIITRQKRIAQLIEDIIEKDPSLKTVFTEGMAVSNTNKERDAVLNNYHKNPTSQNEDAVYFKYGGSAVLEAQGKIVTAPAEYKDTNDRGATSRNPFIIHKERNDDLMHILYHQGHPKMLVVYGFSHDFTRVINEYNTNHSERTFGLIELMPEEFSEFLKKERDSLKEYH